MTIKGELLEIEGLHTADGPSISEINNLPPVQRVQVAERLSVLSDDFVFFNHGLFFTEAGFSSDPVEEYMLVNDDTQAVFAVEYDRPLFKGLEFPKDDTWNRVLLGCKKDFWPGLYRRLNTLIAANRFNKKVYSCFMSNVYIPDPNSWSGNKTDCDINPSHWGPMCEMADKGLRGNPDFSGNVFPSKPVGIKIYVAGVSGPDRLAYMRSALRPYVAYDVAEPKTLALQEVLGSNAVQD
jgi:hypothetical protein